MNSEQSELRTMGFFGIFKEAYKITFSWKKIFSHITLALLLPLSILYFSQIQVSNFIQTKTFRNRQTDRWIAYSIIEAVYVIFFLFFSFLSTSVVSYTIACFYASKETTFKNVFCTVVPGVWKRLIVTSLLFFFIFALFSGVALGAAFLFVALNFGDYGEGGPKILIFVICLSIPYIIGVVFLNVFWHLACVISVLEKSCGIKALKRSMKLVKGKIWVSCAMFTILRICFAAILASFSILVVFSDILGTAGKVCVGILFYLLLPIYFHFVLAIENVVYFACKSYQHEDMDNFDENLEISFVPLKEDKDIPV